MTKSICTSVRLTIDQYLRLKRRARKARMTMSAYIIQHGLSEPPNHKYWRKDASAT